MYSCDSDVYYGDKYKINKNVDTWRMRWLILSHSVFCNFRQALCMLQVLQQLNNIRCSTVSFFVRRVQKPVPSHYHVTNYRARRQVINTLYYGVSIVYISSNLVMLEGGPPQIAASAHIFRSSNHFSEEFESAISYLLLEFLLATASLCSPTPKWCKQAGHHER